MTGSLETSLTLIVLAASRRVASLAPGLNFALASSSRFVPPIPQPPVLFP